MTCPSPQEINMFEDHELDRHHREELTRHIQTCSQCSQVLADIKSVKKLMDKRTKRHEPGFIPAFRPGPPERSKSKSNWSLRPAIAVVCFLVDSGGHLGLWPQRYPGILYG